MTKWTVTEGPTPGMIEVDGPAIACRGFTVATDVNEKKALQKIADANLIAAAPDMYQALRILVEVIEDPEQFDHCTEAAREALAKARGEAC